MTKLNFEDVYREHFKAVYRRCLYMVHDHEQAEDLTQEIFLSVFRHLHKFDGRSKVSTWLYRIVINTFLMSRRKKPLPAFAVVEHSSTPQPDTAFAVKEALAKLTARDRELLIRKYVVGETYEDLASGENANTVKTRCRRAGQKFMAAIA